METKTINLEIIDHEHKISKDGKTTYCRFKTNQGWASCFDKVLIEDIVKSEGRTLECQVTVDDQERIVIKKVLGEAKAGDVTAHNLPPKETIALPEDKLFPNKNTTMYVSYVKDLVVSGIEVDKAVEIIKFAQKAF